jgi:hypothetical protein
MATWLGHGIGGVAVTKALGSGPRGLALGFAVANVPDLDLLLGVVVEGDSGAFHRAWWSHTPATAVFGVVAVLVGYALIQALGRRPFEGRRAGGYAAFVSLALLTHPVADFVLINPTILVPYPEIENARDLPLAAGRELLALLTDLIFYGLIVLALYRHYVRLRQRAA